MCISPPCPSALIIGASRGLGLALAREYVGRGWRVTATARGRVRTDLHDLADQSGGRLEIEGVDIVAQNQIAALRDRLEGRSFDLLFVNAGVTNNPAETIGEVSSDEFVRVMVTNALGPMRVVEAMEDLVPATGTIGVMSSRLGSVAENKHGGWEVYRASKAALNTLMRSFAARHIDDRRALLIITPGWVRTEMGGPEADLSIEQSIPRVVDTITAQSGNPGLRYLDYRGRSIRW
jgi:NAD(P)-dependent dehydrogenase (short-subunit alcohol dehydrogenase family)